MESGMLERFYYWFRDVTSRPEERGEYSSGYWQDLIRQGARDMCRSGDGRLLEVGCGEGLLLAQLIKAFPGLEVWGVDGWSEILSRARKRLEGIRSGVSLHKADAADLPFKDCFFDTVVCVNVYYNMESIQKVRNAILEMARVCKRGGRIVFDIRNSLNPLLVVKYKLARYYDATVTTLPLNTYNPGQIRSILKEAGFEVVQERPLFFNFKPLAPIIMFEAVRK